MENEGPIPLADGVDAVADIWFVHGLRGDAIKTWSKDGVCWPRDLLPQELPNVRIFTWGYDSSVANFGGSVSQASIFGHGGNLLRDIASKRGPAEKDRALIFVGHSLGGLAVKQALIRSAQYFHNRENERLGLIYQHTEALIFLGTPHRGSDKAELGQMVANIAKVSLRQPNSKLIRALSRESDVLEQQRQAFASVSSNVLIACFYEEMPTSFRRILRVNLGVIVPERSASIDGFGIERIGIRASHSDMCKFSNVSQLGFQRVFDRFKDYVHRAEEQVAASAEQAQLVEMAQEEEREIARTELIKSLEFDGMNFEEDSVTDAHWNTFQWLFETSSSQNESLEGNGPATFVPWLRSSAPLYWITGKAGSGKSTLMKFIFTHPEFDRNLRCWAGDRQLIRAKFFIINRAPSALQKSGEGLLRTLLIQLLKASPAFMWIINEYTVVESWSWRTLRKAFRACLEHKPPGIKICFVIDGLDEYNIPAHSSDPHRQDRKYSK